MSQSRMKYRLLRGIRYYSKRYDKYVILGKGYKSDGATGAVDISGPIPTQVLETGKVVFKSKGWWVHDKLCDTGKFADGTPCKNWQASMILKDILKEEGRWVRDFWWFFATWLGGGGKARENGMF